MRIHIYYRKIHKDVVIGPIGASFNLGNTHMMYKKEFINRTLTDDFIAEHLKDGLRFIQNYSVTSVLNMLDHAKLNVFQLSRLLKAVFDINHYHDANVSVFINGQSAPALTFAM